MAVSAEGLAKGLVGITTGFIDTTEKFNQMDRAKAAEERKVAEDRRAEEKLELLKTEKEQSTKEFKLRVEQIEKNTAAADSFKRLQILKYETSPEFLEMEFSSGRVPKLVGDYEEYLKRTDPTTYKKYVIDGEFNFNLEDLRNRDFIAFRQNTFNAGFDAEYDNLDSQNLSKVAQVIQKTYKADKKQTTDLAVRNVFNAIKVTELGAQLTAMQQSVESVQSYLDMYAGTGKLDIKTATKDGIPVYILTEDGEQRTMLPQELMAHLEKGSLEAIYASNELEKAQQKSEADALKTRETIVDIETKEVDKQQKLIELREAEKIGTKEYRDLVRQLKKDQEERIIRQLDGLGDKGYGIADRKAPEVKSQALAFFKTFGYQEGSEDIVTYFADDILSGPEGKNTTKVLNAMRDINDVVNNMPKTKTEGDKEKQKETAKQLNDIASKTTQDLGNAKFEWGIQPDTNKIVFLINGIEVSQIALTNMKENMEKSVKGASQVVGGE